MLILWLRYNCITEFYSYETPVGNELYASSISGVQPN
jgi:hypothetical protein